MRLFKIKQKGISIMMALILTVLLALLGTYMLTMTTLTTIGTSQSEASMQVWFAARSGAEWAIHQSLSASDGGCTCATNCCTGINAQTLNFNEAGLDGYQAAISCSASNYIEAGNNYCVYDLGVDASNNSSSQFTSVSRTLTLSISDRNAP
jgi:Tfp pilus assembly protein PilX